MTPEKLEVFEEAFRLPFASCRGACTCGREFFDNGNSYDWERGEKENLMRRGATALDHSVQCLQIEGRDYVLDCPCWHDKAKRVISFLDAHAEGIVEYFSLEKRRKQKEADRSPLVADAGALPKDEVIARWIAEPDTILEAIYTNPIEGCRLSGYVASHRNGLAAYGKTKEEAIRAEIALDEFSDKARNSMPSKT